MKIIEKNKKAFFDYEIEEKYEAGIVLKGWEVKSIKAGDVSLKESFCFVFGGEVFLKNAHIAPYKMGVAFEKQDSRQDRKLLLNKREINKLIGKIKEKGLTVVPLMIYLKNGRIKMEIALAKGKKLFDKKQSIKEKDIKRDQEREMSRYK
ncbi:MAG: SsrA-binding protein SmpB [Firmicutes bacterium]|nr:SsrA-binding protein SmpB [Bacillota bacterium]